VVNGMGPSKIKDLFHECFQSSRNYPRPEANGKLFIKDSISIQNPKHANILCGFAGFLQCNDEDIMMRI
jgi:DNA polymerase/3'-5' exonuclease PolX